MKWIGSFAMAAFLVGSCCFGQMPPSRVTKASTVVDSGYSITVAPPAGPIRLGSPINVTVTVTNAGGKEILWRSEFSDTAYQAFRFQLAQNGQEAEKTPFHRKVRGEQRPGDPPEVEHGSSITSSLAAGKSFTFTIDLKRLYHITEPGLYTLDVSRVEDDNVTIVRAQTLTLKVAR